MELVKTIPPLEVGHTLSNGYMAIAVKEIGALKENMRIYKVVALRPDHVLHKYVVWTAIASRSTDAYDCERGSYFEDLAEAVEYFNEGI